MSESSTNEITCSQCSTPPVDERGLCVEHLLKYQQSLYLQAAMLVSAQQEINQDLNAAYGGILPPRHSYLPRPPFQGDRLTLNNLNITNSTVGVVNLGKAQNIDSVVSMMHGEGSSDVADALTNFTESVLKSNELSDVIRAELIEAVELLAVQSRVEPEKRMKLVGAVIDRIGVLAQDASTVLSAWQQLEPLIKLALGAN